MSVNVGTIDLGLDINRNSFNQQLKGISSGAERSVKGAFGGLGNKIGIVMGIAAMTAFAKSCLDLGSDLTEVQNVVDTVFPSINNQVNNFASNAMEQFGLSETVAKKYMGTLGAMSKSMGFTEEQSYKMAEAVAGLSGDVASFYNMSSDEAYTKLKSIWTGETESLKELGVIMTQANLDQYALNNGFGKTTRAMTEQEKAMLRYKYVMASLSAAQGDFAKTSDSWANQTRVLALNLESLKATIGQGLINMLTPVVKGLNFLIQKLQIAAQYFKAFTELIFGVQKPVGQTKANTEELANSLGGSGGVAQSAKKAGKAIKGSLSSFDQLNVISKGASESMDDLAGGVGGVGNVDLGTLSTEKSVGSIDKISESLEKLRNSPLFKPLTESMEIFKGSWKDLGVAMEPVMQNLSKWVNEKLIPGKLGMLAGQIQTVSGAMQLFSSILKKDFNNMGWLETSIGGITKWTSGFLKLYAPEFISKAFDGFVLKYGTMWQQCRQKLKEHGDPTKLEFTDLLDFYKEEFKKRLENALPESFKTLWTKIATDMPTHVGTIIGKANTEFERLGKEIKTFIEPFKGYFSEVFLAINNKLPVDIIKLKNTIDTKFTELRTSAITNLRQLPGAISTIWTSLTTKAGTDFNPFKAKLKSVWDSVGVVAKASWKGTANIIIGGFNNIIKALNIFVAHWNNIKIKVPDINVFGKTIKGFTTGVPQLNPIQDLKYLANGGLASAPTLAVVGDNKNARNDPEVIAPLSKLQGMIGSGSNEATISVLRAILEAVKGNQGDTVIKLNETEFGRATIKAINNYQRQTGQTLVII